MRVLVVVATEPELTAVKTGPVGPHEVEVLITGVGMVATAARTARVLAERRVDLAFNFGVCGTLDRSIPLGEVVHVVEDQLSELGAQDGDAFLPIEHMGLPAQWKFTNTAAPVNQALNALRRVRGVTVNTVHGQTDAIARVIQRLGPDVETMEGAAFAFACEQAGVPYAQVRAVSNMVERRNRSAWRLDLAIANLHAAMKRILDSL